MAEKKKKRINPGKKGSPCMWINRIGDRITGTYQGMSNGSGRQAVFKPNDDEKDIYVDVSQLTFKKG